MNWSRKNWLTQYMQNVRISRLITIFVANDRSKEKSILSQLLYHFLDLFYLYINIYFLFFWLKFYTIEYKLYGNYSSREKKNYTIFSAVYRKE